MQAKIFNICFREMAPEHLRLAPRNPGVLDKDPKYRILVAANPPLNTYTHKLGATTAKSCNKFQYLY